MTRFEMLAHIDVKAGAVRSLYITVAPGQEATYIMKGQQAREYAAVSFGGAPPPLVAAEAASMGITAQAAAMSIMAMESQWSTVAGQIEYVRRSAKLAVEAAPSEDAAKQAYEGCIATFSAFL